MKFSKVVPGLQAQTAPTVHKVTVATSAANPGLGFRVLGFRVLGFRVLGFRV